MTGATTLASAAGAVALLAAFLGHEKRAPAPMLRLGLLRIRPLAAATLGILANSGAYTAAVFLGSIYLQRVLGQSPFSAGLAFIPMALAGLVAGTLAARVLAHGRWGAIAGSGLCLSIAGFLLLAAAPRDGGYVPGVLPGFLLLGFGISLTYVALSTTAGEDVPATEKGVAYGVFESGTHIGGTVTLAAVATAAAWPDTLATGLQIALLVAAAIAAAGWTAVVAFGRGAQRA